MSNSSNSEGNFKSMTSCLQIAKSTRWLAISAVIRNIRHIIFCSKATSIHSICSPRSASCHLNQQIRSRRVTACDRTLTVTASIYSTIMTSSSHSSTSSPRIKRSLSTIRLCQPVVIVMQIYQGVSYPRLFASMSRQLSWLIPQGNSSQSQTSRTSCTMRRRRSSITSNSSLLHL